MSYLPANAPSRLSYTNKLIQKPFVSQDEVGNTTRAVVFLAHEIRRRRNDKINRRVIERGQKPQRVFDNDSAQ
jgi:hypothetical protein